MQVLTQIDFINLYVGVFLVNYYCTPEGAARRRRRRAVNQAGASEHSKLPLDSLELHSSPSPSLPSKPFCFLSSAFFSFLDKPKTFLERFLARSPREASSDDRLSETELDSKLCLSFFLPRLRRNIEGIASLPLCPPRNRRVCSYCDDTDFCLEEPFNEIKQTLNFDILYFATTSILYNNMCPRAFRDTYRV